MKTSRYNLSWNAILAPCEIKTLQSGRVSKVLKAQSYLEFVTKPKLVRLKMKKSMS